MSNVRLSKERKELIAYRVAVEWVESAQRYIASGKRPATFTSIVADRIWCEVCRYCDSIDVDPCDVSDRVLAAIATQAKHEVKMLVATL